MKPHLQRALEALEDIQHRRSLTDKELAQQCAFKMLLDYRGRKERTGLQSPSPESA